MDGARLRYAVAAGGRLRRPAARARARARWDDRELARARARARAEHRVLVPDLPGHGHSDALPDAAHLDGSPTASSRWPRRRRSRARSGSATRSAATVALRAAVRRPDAVRGVVLAAAAGIGSSTRLGRVTVTLMGLVEPGKAIAPHRRRLGELDARPTRRVRLVGSGGRDALEPELAEAFFTGPAFHTKTRQAGRALLGTDPARRARADRVSRASACGARATSGSSSTTGSNTHAASARRSGRSPAAVTS